MDPRVLSRFVIIVAVATLVVFSISVGYEYFTPPPGDDEVRKGDILLDDKQYEEAIQWFDKALAVQPNHRWALMGRALAFIQMERYPEAMAELDYIIELLPKIAEADDMTGRGVLAAAYAKRGNVHDRQGRYEKALADYVRSLEIDSGTVSGPDLFYKILYDPRPSNVRDRGRYLYEQLQKPEGERLMRVPKLDPKQRIY